MTNYELSDEETQKLFDSYVPVAEHPGGTDYLMTKSLEVVKEELLRKKDGRHPDPSQKTNN